MCWTPPHTNKYKHRKQDMILLQTTGRKDEPNVVLYGNRNEYVLMVSIFCGFYRIIMLY